MAEIVPGVTRIQAVFEGTSGLPEDRFINVFHFQRTGGGGSYEDQLEDQFAAVNDFYCTNVALTGEAVWDRMGKGAINATLSDMRAYDLESTDNPRPPTLSHYVGLDPGTAQTLPSELAVCVSYYSLVNQPSSRGRIYIGPLQGTSVEAGSHPARVSTDFMHILAESAKRLASRTDVIWSVLTHPSGGAAEMKAITNGWVDNAFDVIRKRGEDSTGRELWAV